MKRVSLFCRYEPAAYLRYAIASFLSAPRVVRGNEHG